MSQNGWRHATIKFDDEGLDEIVVELWDGDSISTTVFADTLDEARISTQHWIEGTIMQ